MLLPGERAREMPLFISPFPWGLAPISLLDGGSTRTVNGHFVTLNPETDRQRTYRGQSYAVDLTKLRDFGLRAPGWRPRDPTVYATFGEPVYAPCAGEVLSAQDDLPVPERDTFLLEGNHVFIEPDPMYEFAPENLSL